MSLDLEKVMAELQEKADAERAAKAPKPTVTVNENGEFVVSKELMVAMKANTILSTEKIEKGGKVQDKHTYGNNRISFVENPSKGCMLMVINSMETMPTRGDTLRLTLAGKAKDTTKTNYAELIYEHFGKEVVETTKGVFEATMIVNSPAGNGCILVPLEGAYDAPSVRDGSLAEELSEDEAEAIEIATVDSLDEAVTDLAAEEEVLTIPERLEEIGNEMQEVVEINVTTHTDIILE